MAEALEDAESFISSISDSEEEEKVVHEQETTTPEIPTPTYTDEEIQKLVNFIQKMSCLFALDHNDWSEDTTNTITKWLLEVNQLMLVIFYSGNKLTASLTFPSEPVHDLTYYLREPNHIFTLDGFHDEVIFGTITEDIDGTLLTVLENVYAPIFFDTKEWRDNVRSKISGAFHEFLCFLTDLHYKMSGMTVLYVPQNIHKLNVNTVIKDHELIRQYEQIAVFWAASIRNCLSDKQQIVPHDLVTPIDEFKFWIYRSEVLQGLYTQLRHKNVQYFIEILKKAQSVYIKQIIELTEQCKQEVDEANDNIKYLQVIVNPCSELDKCKSPTEIPPKLPEIIHLFRFVWTKSQYFNTREYITNLFRTLSNQIIAICIKHINIEKILTGNPRFGIKMCDISINCCLHYKTMYEIMSERHKLENPNIGWNLDNPTIFNHIDTFIERCNDLIDICESMIVFGRIDETEKEIRKPLFFGSRSKEFEATCEMVQTKFTEGLRNLKTDLTEVILDVHNNKWYDSIVKYRELVHNLEGVLQHLLSEVFVTVCNLDEGVEALTTLHFISYRHTIRSYYLSKVTEVWEMLAAQITHTDKLIAKESEKRLAWIPKYSSKAINCKINLERMARLKSILTEAIWLPDVPKSVTVLEDYNKLEKKLQAGFKKSFKDWLDSLGMNLTTLLDRTLLIRSKTHNGQLECNIHKSVLIICDEAKHFENLGFQIPVNVNQIYSKADNLISTYNHVVAVALDYNKIISALSKEELQLFRPLIAACDKKIAPGLTKLKWGGDYTEKYIEDCAKYTTQLQEFLEKYKRTNRTIGELCEKICAFPILKIDTGKQVTLDQLFRDIKQYHNKATQELSTYYDNILDLISDIYSCKGGFEQYMDSMNPEWCNYIKHFDKMTEAVFSINVKDSLEEIYKCLHGDEDVGPSPFLMMEIDIKESQIIFDPTFDKIADIFNDSLKLIIQTFKNLPRLWKYFKLKEDKEAKSFVEVIENDDFKKMKYEINREIRRNEEKFIAHLKLWDEYKFIWELDKDEYMQNYENTDREAEQYSDDIQNYTILGNKIIMMDAVHNVDSILVNSGKLQDTILKHIEDWQRRHIVCLRKKSIEKMNAIYKYMKTNSERILVVPRSISEIKKASALYEKLLLEIPPKQDEFKTIFDLFKVLREYEDNIPKEINDLVSNLEGEWQKYLETLAEGEDLIGNTRDNFKLNLLSQSDKLKSKAKKLSKEFQENIPTTSDISTSKAFEILNKYREEMQSLFEQEANIISDLNEFDMHQPENTDLRKLNEDIQAMNEIWNLIYDWENAWEEYKLGNFWKINLIEMEDYANTLYKQLTQLYRKYSEKNFAILETTRKHVDEFRKTLPLVTALKNQALRTRHWERVHELVGQDFDHNSEKFTLEAIIEMNFQAHEEQIQEISHAATMELQIENGLKTISDIWRSMLLETPHFKDGIYRITGVDQCFEILEDHLTQISSMKSTRYFEPFSKQVDFWEKSLSYVMETLEQALSIQRQWLYLDNIFSGEDIKAQLPAENKKFLMLTNQWKNITAAMHAAETVFKAIHIKPAMWLLDSLIVMDKHFEEIQRALEVYLERKRQIFPRFYFVSNDDLLEILGNANKPQQVQIHLKKLFDNLYKLELKKLQLKKIKWEAQGMYSDDGEYVDFKEPILLEGPAEIWLGIVEKSMTSTLRDKLKKTRMSLKKNLILRDKWIASWPGQLCLTSSLIQWTADCTKSLNQCKILNERRPLKKLIKKQNEVLNTLSEMSRKELPKQLRLKVNTIITVEIHGKDVIERMYTANCQDVNSFEWFSQLRFYWEQNRDTCVIQQTNTEHLYGYEYTGNSGRLVITPLTDRCYITLTTALHLNRGGSPKGPAGTGKTETVKDLGKALGMWVIVTNCSEGLDYKSIGKNFSGLAQTGMWGCFDEFNRINIEVLSVVAQQILSILNALSAKQKRFNFEGKEINLIPTVGIFITMNPGYAGRTELPDNLKSMFRSIAMIVPDNVIIAENLLFSDGFQNSRNLARKVYSLYELAKRQLSIQVHYDFGLRSMVAVLRYAGQKRRQLTDIKEEEIIYLAMKDMNMARLTANDLPLFYGIMSDIFPGVIIPKIDYSDFETAIKDDLITNGHQVISAAVNKVIELYETKNSRHSVMILGDTGTAKTVTWKTLQGAYGRMKAANQPNWVDVVVYPINPKALNLAELYGEYNLSTDEWMDGVISNTMRTACADESPTQKWILFDGPVDAVWIENMNSVMDDNKILTLVNSERITMPAQVSLLFEVADLSVASPATVSRCGMVYNDYNDWGWRPYVNSWLAKQEPERYVKILKRLFDNYLDKVLEFKRKNCTETVVINELNLVTSMCHLLSCFATKQNGIVEDDENTMIIMTKLWFLFSMVWSVCATVDEIGRQQMDTIVRELETAFPLKNTIYDYFVDPETKSFVPWEDKLPRNWTYNNETPFYKIIVPTIDTIRYEYLVSNLLSAGNPVLLVGKVGTGKTSTAITATESFDKDKFSILSINISAQTTSAGLQESIESKTEKRTKNTFVPLGNKKMIVFLDDFNMPAKDTYGSQPPLELIRQWIDYQFWYNRKTQQRTYVKQTLLMAAMGPPGGGRQFISPRNLSRFSVINMTFPTNEIILQIFGTILKQHLNDFSKTIQKTWKQITEATTYIYNSVSSKMLPTPKKSHYLFNLRDISRVFQGLLRSSAEYHTTQSMFLRLWTHEINRVFCDRLVDQSDSNWFQNEINHCLEKYFNIEIKYLCENDQLPIFGDFISTKGYYEDFQDMDALRKFMENKQEESNKTPGKIKMDLVFFQEAIHHICRIARVISQPRGHMLNIAIGGCGRQVLTQMATFICDLHIFRIKITKKYKTAEFREDLKILYKMCGVMNREVVFIFTNNQIADETFLEIINNMLSTGEINLFKTDEFDEIKSEMEVFAKKAGISLTTEAMYNFFMERIRNNLHIVLCFSPIGKSFRDYIRQYPAIINSTTTNWIADWPQSALLEVAQKFLSICTLNVKSQKEDNIRRSSLDDIATEEQKLQKATSTIFSKIHTSVLEMSETMLLEMKRHNYVTPINYLELVTGFQRMLNRKRDEIFEESNKLRNGLSKLKDTAEKVAGISEELKESQEKISKLSAEINEYMTVIQIQTKEVDQRKQSVAAESKVIAKEEAECKILADQAQADLSEVMPAFQAAIKALDALNKKDIAEVKSYGRPPPKVGKVMEAVLILLGKEPTWEMAKRVLAEPNFLIMLRDYDKDHISDKTLKKIAIYTRDSELEPEKVGIVSLACKSLMIWIKAIENYGRVYRVVAPKKAVLDKALESLGKKQTMLQEAEKNLAELNDRLQKLQDDYNERSKIQNELLQKSQKLKTQLDRAVTLVDSLSGERLRWIETVKLLDSQFNNLPGDCIISMAFVSYLGPFDTIYRESLLSYWQNMVVQFKIPSSENLRVTDFLSSPAQIREWNIQGLPYDNFSTENGIIITQGTRWPLIIDPQTQAMGWIKNLEKENLIIIDFGMVDYLKKLEQSLENGTAVLLKNVGETIESSITPILQKALTVDQSGRTFINFNDKFIPYHSSFRFYITTKFSNPHYLPEILSKTTLVNFTVKVNGLQAQLLRIIVQKERPVLEEQKNNLVMTIAQNKKTLIDLDNEILRLLNETRGSIVEDDELYFTLQLSRKTANSVKDSLRIAEDTEIEIDAARQMYQPVAKRASVLFFILIDMSNIDPMYQFSLNSYIILFIQSIEGSPKSPMIQTRIENINEYHTYAVYKNTCRGLFERHKLLFSCHMCVKILEVSGKMNFTEYEFLLKGGIVLDKKTQAQNPAPDWITEQNWDNITELDKIAGFNGIIDSFTNDTTEWKEWYYTTNPEVNPLIGKWNSILNSFQKILVIRCVRPDRISACMTNFVMDILGSRYVEPPVLDLKAIFKESISKTPLVFVLSPGVDPTSALINLAEQVDMKEQLYSVSLGQGQAPIATKLLINGVKEGHWVFLANCHLSLSWMPELDKIIDTIQNEKISRRFRLWLSSNPHPDFPLSILQSSIKMTTEPPRGIKANLKRLFNTITEEQFERCTQISKYKKLLFGLCFFHTVLLERRKFQQLGWNVVYSFNDSDFEISESLLVLYLNEYKETPWNALKYLIAEVNYGGHVTDDWDRRLLKTYIDQFFNESALNFTQYRLSSLNTYYIPRDGPRQSYIDYIQRLPNFDQPEAYGQHPNADIASLIGETRMMFNILISLQVQKQTTEGETKEDKVLNLVEDILSKIPKVIDYEATSELIGPNKTPLHVVLLQEIERYNILLKEMRSGLENLQKGIQGLILMSSDLDDMFNSVYEGRIPAAWLKAYPSLKPLGSWARDLILRVEHFNIWAKYARAPKIFWLSAFTFPGGFLTAVMQTTARSTQIPIDELVWEFTVSDNDDPDMTIMKYSNDDGVLVRGCFLEGAGWNLNEQCLQEPKPMELITTMPVIQFKPVEHHKKRNLKTYTCPCYSFPDRERSFVIAIDLKSGMENSDYWIKRGTAILLSLST